MAGTFGAVVKNGADSYILSNNHVLADEDRLPPGSPIFQPGLLDGGDPKKDKVAELTRAIKLQAKGFNQVDCAIAKGINATILSRDILHIGPPAGTAQAAIDMRVHKFGRTTSYTVGHVTSIATDVTVTYETGKYAFENQIIIVGDPAPFSAAGDSGSLILDRQTNNAVGLLFAGSSSHTIANHIAEALKALNVTLA
jgi:Peptidase family S64